MNEIHEPPGGWKYWAFLSYSHQDNVAERADGRRGCIQWAEWLQGALESYRVPEEFRSRTTATNEPMPTRFFPVFQDEKELPLNADLAASIRAALTQSRYLILICSPRSAKSKYVNEEVRLFKEIGRESRILALIVDGEPKTSLGKAEFAEEECFCPALLHPLDSNGMVDATRQAKEPIAGDVRVKDEWHPHEAAASERRKRSDVLEFMKLKLIAGLIGIGFDELAQRDKARHDREQRKRIRILTMVSALIAVLAIAAVLAAVQAVRNGQTAETNAATARTNETLAKQNEQRAVEVGSRGAFDVANFFLKQNDPARALAWLAKSLKINPRNRLASDTALLLLLERDWAVPALSTSLHAGELLAADFSADGQRLVTGSADRTARVWDPSTKRPLTASMEHAAAVTSVAFSPDGASLLTQCADNSLRVWDAATGLPRTAPLRPVSNALEVKWSPDSSFILARCSNACVWLWGVANGRSVGPLSLKDLADIPEALQEIVYFGASSDGKEVLALTDNGIARVWDAQSGEQMLERRNARGFSPDGKFLLAFTGSDEGSENAEPCRAERVDVATGKRLGKTWKTAPKSALPGEDEDLPRRVFFHPDGRRAIIGYESGVALIWDTVTGNRLSSGLLPGHEIENVHFSPAGDRFIAIYFNGTVTAHDVTTNYPPQLQVIEFPSGKAIGTPIDSPDSINDAAFTPDGHGIIIAGQNGVARRLLVAAAPDREAEPLRHGASILSARYSPDFRFAITRSEKDARVWDIRSGKMQSADVFEGVDYWATANFSPDARRLVAYGYENTARVFDVATGRAVTPLLWHGAPVNDAVFSPDGTMVLTVSEDKTMRLWNAATGEPCTPPLLTEQPMSRARFYRGGSRIVVWFNSNSSEEAESCAQVWDLAPGKPAGATLRHQHDIRSVHFSSDGQRIVTVSGDWVRVWEVSSGNKIAHLEVEAVHDADFSPTGERLLILSGNEARIWDFHAEKEPSVVLRDTVQLFDGGFDDGGRQVWALSGDGVLLRWDFATGKLVAGSDHHPEFEKAWAVLSHDARRSLSQSLGQLARLQVWDTETGAPVGDTIDETEFFPRLTKFSPDGRRALFFRLGEFVWRDFPSVDVAPSELAALLECVGSQRLTDSGALVLTPHDEFFILREKIEASAGNDDATCVLKWFVANRSHRTISPFASISIRDWIDQRLANLRDTPASNQAELSLRHDLVAKCRRFFPQDPLLLLHAVEEVARSNPAEARTLLTVTGRIAPEVEIPERLKSLLKPSAKLKVSDGRSTEEAETPPVAAPLRRRRR